MAALNDRLNWLCFRTVQSKDLPHKEREDGLDPHIGENMIACCSVVGSRVLEVRCGLGTMLFLNVYFRPTSKALRSTIRVK
jgi:hypothetical protein